MYPFTHFNETPLLIESNVIQGENTYSVIIGKNGIGKSTLLAEMIAFEMLQNTFSNRRNIIAVSTSPFDKFRRAYKSGNSSYNYIGMKGTMGSSAISLISSATTGLLANIVNNNNISHLTKIFSFLGYEPSIQLIFKASIKSKNLLDKRFYQVLQESIIQGDDWYQDLARRVDKETYQLLSNLTIRDKEDLLNALHYLEELYSYGGNVSLNIDFGSQLDKENLLKVTSIFSLMKAGVVRLMDVRLINKNYGRISLRRASSGEQCMLVMFLGIAGHIQNNSLIFIDEPEISLHPFWQEKFIDTLTQIFSNYKNCQFFIATHSPQIVSKLSSRNCFVTSLTKNKIYCASEFINRSSDYQLAELFDAPGTMNEYITRICFNLLSSVKSSKELSSSDKSMLAKLDGFFINLNQDDPVRELILSVKEVVNIYASNK
jgi:predicted ATPase